MADSFSQAGDSCSRCFLFFSCLFLFFFLQNKNPLYSSISLFVLLKKTQINKTKQPTDNNKKLYQHTIHNPLFICLFEDFSFEKWKKKPEFVYWICPKVRW